MLLFLIFIPRLLELDRFLTADEPLFLAHAREFARAFTTGNLGQTLGIGYPGVTVAGWTAVVVGLAGEEMAAYVAGRVATALLTGLLLVLIYHFSQRLWGHWPAFLAVSLLALDPYTLAYSRLFHIEAVLAFLMTLVALTTLLWLRDNRRHLWGLAGLFTGLALLTKSTALLLGPLLLLVWVGWAITMGQARNPAWWRGRLGGLLGIAGIAGLTFVLFWPAMWLDPTEPVRLTFGKLLNDQEAGTGNLGFFWWGRFVDDPGPGFYPVAFLLKATPWLLAGLILSGIYCLRPSAQASSTGRQRYASQVCLWLFALGYLLLMTLASKKSVRYLLPAFPTLYLLTGVALERVRHAGMFPRISQNSSLARPAAGVALLLLLLFTFFYHPYYFTYYNPLVLGWRWAPQTLLVGWGEGLDEAAAYLNRKTGDPVTAWYEWLFPLFYRGEVQAAVPAENLLTAHHSVLYINQVQRDIPDPNIISYFQTRRRPEHTVRLAGIEYAWVYPGPVVGLRPDPQPGYPLAGDFGGEVRLLGYDLEAQPVLSGSTLLVTLYWRVLATPPAERFVYVRLVDPQGHIWASADSPPVMGLWPVNRWEPGLLLEDAQALPIPPGTPPGLYRLEVGMYDPTDGQILAAAGQPTGQGGGLLLGEVSVEWQNLPPGEVDLPQQTQTHLSPEISLIGYDTLPAAAISGELLPLRLAWQKRSSLFQSWRVGEPMVMFEWSREGQYQAEQLEPLPLPASQWDGGATLRSQHDLIVPPALETGRYEVRLLAHDGSQPLGEPFYLGTVEVTAPPRRFNLPETASLPIGEAQLAQEVSLAGYTLTQADQTLQLELYWQTNQPLMSRYKVFAQLLDPANGVVSQSDQFPATGQRPTTGWLPGEIVSDSHRLALPDLSASEGPYRLIAGLYNPLNGERLPLLDKNGGVSGDAILVAEVTLP